MTKEEIKKELLDGREIVVAGGEGKKDFSASVFFLEDDGTVTAWSRHIGEICGRELDFIVDHLAGLSAEGHVLTACGLD